MCVKHLHAREREAYLAENVVARVFIGRQGDARPQIRDHSNIARAYAALGKEGVDEINALILHVAKDLGFADVSILSSDTTAQELPIGPRSRRRPLSATQHHPTTSLGGISWHGKEPCKFMSSI